VSVTDANRKGGREDGRDDGEVNKRLVHRSRRRREMRNWIRKNSTYLISIVLLVLSFLSSLPQYKWWRRRQKSILKAIIIMTHHQPFLPGIHPLLLRQARSIF